MTIEKIETLVIPVRVPVGLLTGSISCVTNALNTAVTVLIT
ncbi:MAG: hypothetical protein O8C66_07275 [Candidatus Methanoperedens sp.]|nr:hypothetical protein [Candidatus Methanoperedens sp.]MCZ7370295.1 hypothetical protein [Candidatus Methanoperedens sp.]